MCCKNTYIFLLHNSALLSLHVCFEWLILLHCMRLFPTRTPFVFAPTLLCVRVWLIYIIIWVLLFLYYKGIFLMASRGPLPYLCWHLLLLLLIIRPFESSWKLLLVETLNALGMSRLNGGWIAPLIPNSLPVYSKACFSLLWAWSWSSSIYCGVGTTCCRLCGYYSNSYWRIKTLT